MATNFDLTYTDIFSLVGERMVLVGKFVKISMVFRNATGWWAEGVDEDNTIRRVRLPDPMAVPVLAHHN